MRTRPVLLAVALLAAAMFAGGSRPAAAQDVPLATVSLISQSVWNDPTKPLKITVDVTNRSEAVMDRLSLVLVIHAPARARSIYELSLRADPTPPIFALPFPRRGEILPGEVRRFTLKQPLDVLAARGESALYPVKLQVLSDDTPVAEIRTPLIFLIEEVEVPLDLAWTWELSAPIQYLPNGTFLAGSLEDDVAPGGRIERTVAALERLDGVPLDLVVSSALVEQLERMADGYRILEEDGSARDVPEGTGGASDARAALASLRAIARRPATELLALPLADAHLPALLEAGLRREASALLAEGRDLLRRALGRIPRRDVYRPPGSELDEPTLDALARRGTQTVVVDADYVPPAAGFMFTPPPVVRLVAGTTEVNALRPDPGVAAIAEDARDPGLAAQATLGALAAIWFELPGTPDRGAAMVLPGDPALSPEFLLRFATLVKASPWLDPVIVSRVPSLEAPERRAMPRRPVPTFAPGYVPSVLAAEDALRRFARTAPEATRLVQQLDRGLEVSLGGTFLEDPALGSLFIDAVTATIRRTYEKVRIPDGLVTLASRSGTIPITIENGSGFALDVTVRLIADRRIAFTGGPTMQLRIPPETRTFTFPVMALTTGRFPIKVQLRTPGDPAAAETIAETQMVVRSTAYNRVALFFTVGAALFLLAWWGRRFLPRRKAREP